MGNPITGKIASSLPIASAVSSMQGPITSILGLLSNNKTQPEKKQQEKSETPQDSKNSVKLKPEKKPSQKINIPQKKGSTKKPAGNEKYLKSIDDKLTKLLSKKWQIKSVEKVKSLNKVNTVGKVQYVDRVKQIIKVKIVEKVNNMNSPKNIKFMDKAYKKIRKTGGKAKTGKLSDLQEKFKANLKGFNERKKGRFAGLNERKGVKLNLRAKGKFRGLKEKGGFSDLTKMFKQKSGKKTQLTDLLKPQKVEKLFKGELDISDFIPDIRSLKDFKNLFKHFKDLKNLKNLSNFQKMLKLRRLGNARNLIKGVASIRRGYRAVKAGATVAKGVKAGATVAKGVKAGAAVAKGVKIAATVAKGAKTAATAAKTAATAVKVAKIAATGVKAVTMGVRAAGVAASPYSLGLSIAIAAAVQAAINGATGSIIRQLEDNAASEEILQKNGITALDRVSSFEDFISIAT